MAGYGVLGQILANASPTTFNTLYTASSQTVVSLLNICNQTSSAQQYSVRIRVTGNAANDKQFIVKNTDIKVGESHFLNIGLALAAGDVVEVAASNSGISFTMSGLSA